MMCTLKTAQPFSFIPPHHHHTHFSSDTIIIYINENTSVIVKNGQTPQHASVKSITLLCITFSPVCRILGTWFAGFSYLSADVCRNMVGNCQIGVSLCHKWSHVHYLQTPKRWQGGQSAESWLTSVNLGFLEECKELMNRGMRNVHMGETEKTRKEEEEEEECPGNMGRRRRGRRGERWGARMTDSDRQRQIDRQQSRTEW